MGPQAAPRPSRSEDEGGANGVGGVVIDGTAGSAEAQQEEDEAVRYRYPLREWGWDRERCKAEIAGPGLPIRLAETHPDLFKRAVAMEDAARAGRHGLIAINGLWGRRSRRGQPGDGSWRSWGEATGHL